MKHKQLQLTYKQVFDLKAYQGRAFRMVWRLAEWHMGTMCGDALEAIASGVSCLLTCRKAGRMAGLSPDRAKGVRRYNLDAIFAL